MNKAVKELFSKHGTLDPFALAEHMGINVFFRPLVDLGGYYMKLNNNSQIIIINNMLPRCQQKFVLAHEIGHCLLHPDKYALMLQTSIFATNRFEVEADKFAVNLLLSDSMLHENPERTVDDWASILGLPKEVVRLKIKG